MPDRASESRAPDSLVWGPRLPRAVRKREARPVQQPTDAPPRGLRQSCLTCRTSPAREGGLGCFARDVDAGTSSRTRFSRRSIRAASADELSLLTTESTDRILMFRTARFGAHDALRRRRPLRQRHEGGAVTLRARGDQLTCTWTRLAAMCAGRESGARLRSPWIGSAALTSGVHQTGSCLAPPGAPRSPSRRPHRCHSPR